MLIATTAAFAIDIKFERKLIPSRYLDFDTIMAAIGTQLSQELAESVCCFLHVW